MRELARVDRAPRALLAVADVGDHGVGEQLDAAAHPVAQLLGHARGLGGCLLEQSGEHAPGVVARVDRRGAEQRGDRSELALRLDVVTGERIVEVGAERDAFTPAVAVEQRDRPARDEQDVARGSVGGEDELCCLERRVAGRLVVDEHRVEQPARGCRLARDDCVRIGGEDGVERNQQ